MVFVALGTVHTAATAYHFTRLGRARPTPDDIAMNPVGDVAAPDPVGDVALPDGIGDGNEADLVAPVRSLYRT